MCKSLLAIYYFSVLGWGTIERQYFAHVAESARMVRKGDTEIEVVETLGRPSGRYSAFNGIIFGIGARPAQSYYGGILNVDHLIVSDTWVANFPLPVNIRFFGYDENDLIIDWDEARTVRSIKIPTLDIDERFDDLAIWFGISRAILGQTMEPGKH